MTQVLRRFVPRAPRYVLRPTDNRFLRFAYQDDRKHTFSTRFLNVSETGLAFVVDRDCVPHIGDFIKVEFPVPGQEQVAWFARVVRIEEYRPPRAWQKRLDKENDEVMVAVRFHDLPDGHRSTIRDGLNHKFNEVLKERQKDSVFQLLSYITAHFWKACLYLGLALATFGILYAFSRPTPKYDKDRGSPWGQRYPEFNFFSPKDDNSN
ncbi:MAG: PilZ domain-containing protein [Bdellovibrionaceae bacterium]|nr:PilZ domain-containing protein [Bdellovibrionales bacterium]MCB9085959.1 PilZ domain-containing protein [Pseudobdellovibrionaceae bacterium]